jgi:hypothetical protein
MTTPLTVLAYDHTGNMRVAHYVEPGDQIEWKRNGQTGTHRLNVEQVWRNPAGKVKVYARPVEGGRRLTITKNIFYVFDKNGKRKEPVRQ